MVCKVDYLHPASAEHCSYTPIYALQWQWKESADSGLHKSLPDETIENAWQCLWSWRYWWSSKGTSAISHQGGKKKGICVTRLCTKMYIFVSKNPIHWLSQTFRWCTLADVLPKSKELYWFIVTSRIICRGEIEKYRQKPPSPTPAPHCGVCHLPDHSGTFRLLKRHFSYRIPRCPGWQRLADNLQHTLNNRAVQQGCAPRNVFS